MTTVNILRAAVRMLNAKPAPPTARKGRIVLTLLFMLLTTATQTVFAIETLTVGDYTFTTGSDTDGDYYVVDSPAALTAIANYVNDNSANTCEGKRFKQTGNITLSGMWTPIGKRIVTTSYCFKGTYDGGGYNISGLSTQIDQFNGLFGIIGSGGIVKNVNVVDCTIQGRQAVGGIAGQNRSGGTIDNCTVSGTIEPLNNSLTKEHFGGICGYSYGTIKNCTNFATIKNTTSYSSENSGGIAGTNVGSIQDCFTVGTFNIKNTNGSTNIGVVVGSNSSNGTISGTYYYAGTSGYDAVGENNNTTEGSVDVTRLYTYTSISGLDYVGTTFNIGSQTYCTTGYYAIADEQDLIDLAEYMRGGSDHGCEGVTFKMTADLDFTAMPDNCHDKYIHGSGNFLPIGINSEDGGAVFAGHFDGDGHTITGLSFSYTYNTIGLFRSINSANAVVEGVTLVSPTFSAYNDVGGIVGTLAVGTVRNCAIVGGTITASNEAAGGIVGQCLYNTTYGYTTKTISGCTVVGTTVSGTSKVGIIVGSNTNDSHAAAALTISGCKYHNPADLDVCGYGDGDRYTDGGGNQRVYQARLADGLTAATAAYSHGNDYYFAQDATVTLGHTDRTGYDCSYESSDVTITNGTFTMPASDVSVSATWKKLLENTDISVVAIDDQEWTGSGITPAVTVKDGTTDISGECDFAYSDNQNTGEATVTITAKAASTGYSGSTSATFDIVAKVTNYGAMIISEDQTGKTATLDGDSDEPFAVTSDIDVDKVILRRKFVAGVPTTICLPFDFSNANFDNETFGTLNYVEENKETHQLEAHMTPVTELQANTPYYFEPTETTATPANKDYTEIVFDYTTTIVAGNARSSTTGVWTIVGNYDRVKWTTDTNDPLYSSTHAAELGRAYGYAKKTKTVGGVTYQEGQFVKLGDGAHTRAFRAYMLAPATTNSPDMLPDAIDVVWHNDNATSITSMSDGKSQMSDVWYTINGVKLAGKPTTKGLYINNGRKVVVK